MISKIDHLGIAVNSLDDSVKYYESLGLKCDHREEVPAQKVRTAFFKLGGTDIELLEPTEPDSPIGKFLAKNGEGVHHVAFATDDVERELRCAKTAGLQLIHEHPVDGAGGKLVGFLHPKSTHGVLTEFCAKKS